ncbi:TPA: DUF6157 family protein [Streptococcus suis]
MKKHSTNYYNAFLAVAEDCPVEIAQEPPLKEPKLAVRIQYDRLKDSPYQYTSDQVIYESNGARRGISEEEFFSKGQACMRSSALSKRYGWGIHFDEEGKLALYPRESKEYQAFEKDETLTQIRGMRSSRKRD